MGSRNPIRMPIKILHYMAAFTNLALSASHLGTRYLNAIYVVERSQYDELGALMITVALVGLVLPIITVHFFKTTVYQIN